jgi:hypothetical protein
VSPAVALTLGGREGSSSVSPILLGLALHRRSIRVLHLEPIAGAPGGIARAQTLADDALEAELAGVAKNDVAGFGDVLVELQPGAGAAQQRGELALADLHRLALQVLPVELGGVAIDAHDADHRADVRGGDIAEIGRQLEAIRGARRRGLDHGGGTARRGLAATRNLADFTAMR